LELVDGAELAARALRAVVEDEHVPRAGQARRDPLGFVLVEELLIRRGAAAVVLRIAPAIEQVAALAEASALRALRLGGRGRVVDDEDLVELGRAQEDEVGRGLVVDAVHVHPVAALRRRWTGGSRVVLVVVSRIAERAHLRRAVRLLLALRGV